MHRANPRRLALLMLCALCALCALLFRATPLWAQAAVDVTADVDRTAISSDDVVVLTVSVAGDYTQVDEPQLPLLTAFQVLSTGRSSQFSMVNGVVSSRTSFTYRLAPTGPGTHSIDSISVVVDGITHQTETIDVRVTQGTAPTPTPSISGDEPTGPAPDGLGGQELYVEADVDLAQPYVGQQIVYRFRFYQAVNLLEQPRLSWPAFSGFWAESLAPNRVFEQTVDGTLYRVTEVRQALFATAAGRATIEPAALTIPGGFFRNDVGLETGPVHLEVQALPDGAPADFGGAVGQYEISAWLEPEQARVNEPLTLFVRVAGAGNFATLPDPTQDLDTVLPDWRVYDAQTTTEVLPADGVVQGEKIYERLLVPRTQGESEIPALSLPFFDPAQNAYHRAATTPLAISVAPSSADDSGVPNGPGAKQDVDLIASDIRHIKAAPPALQADSTPPLESAVYWLLWLLPPMAVGVVWVWERRRQRLAHDVAYARSRRAARTARDQLHRARKGSQQDPDAAYAAVAGAITDYVGDKFNVPAAGLTRESVRRLLSEHAVPDELTDRTLSCLDWADSGRFAPGAAGRQVEDLVREAEDVIKALESALTNREAGT